MTTDDFIDLLQQRQLVASGVARQLRAKAAQGDSRITPKSILKYLVKKEIITRGQAKELLETTLVVSDKAESSILGLVSKGNQDVLRSDEPDDEPVLLTPLEEAPSRTTSKSLPAAAPLMGGEDLFGSVTKESAYPESAEVIEKLAGADPAKAAPGSKLRVKEWKRKGKPTSTKKEKGKGKGKAAKGNQWDSPLVLMGGGGLALLVVGSIILWWLVFRESADKDLKLANEQFDKGSYRNAQELYKEFVVKHANHPDYSQAKVRMAMSQLWMETEGGNYAGAAELAPTVIGQIEDEPAFISNADESDGLSEAKQELSSLLPRIAKGLADQADSGADDAEVAKRIAETNTVLELASNAKYVPEGIRPETELSAIRETLERVKTRQQRKTELATALVKMEELVAAGDPAGALKVRASLLRNYPTLIDDPALAEKVLKIAGAEQAAVKFVEAPAAATTTPAESPVIAELALADRRGGEAAATDQPVIVRVDGALYGLKGADGSLLWRRFAGFDATSYPLTLAKGRVVAADAKSGELICLDAATGKLVWRLPLEGKLATPVPLAERLLVASDAGKLYVVEQSSGALLGYVSFTQPLRLPPAVNDRGDRIYVLGEHSNLYTLSTGNLGCMGVYYLGHAAGGMAVPPIAVLNKVIVADNSGVESCQLRALSLNDQGVPTAEAATQRLSGLVVTPLQVAGRRFAALTTQGQTVVYEVAASNDAAALTALASRETQEPEPLAHFGLMHEGHLWVAGRQLTKLAILPTGNQLPVRSIDRDYLGDAFDYPLQADGNVLIHIRRPAGQGGVIVAAMDVAGNKALWETAVAVPPAGAPAVDVSELTITAGSASGAVYLLNREAMTRRVQDEPERLATPSATLTTFSDSLDLSQGRIVLGGVGGKQLIHFRPGDPRQALREVELAGPLSCAPAAWADGFVAATEVGQVFLFSADDGAPLATPFQPPLTPGRKYQWLPPAAVGAGAEAQLAISDGTVKIYLLRIVPQPQPHLEATATVDVGLSPLVTRLAVAGSSVYAGNEAGKLVRFALPDLLPGDDVDVGGRVIWGPYPTPGGVLLATEDGELAAVGDDGAIRWRQPLPHGELSGAPLIDGDTAFLLYPNGGLARVSLTDGAEGAFVELGQPAVAGPVAFGPRLILSAPDGTILVINRP